jgi:mRNA interferase MazF
LVTSPYVPDRGHIVKYDLGEPAIFTVKSIEQIILLSSLGKSNDEIAQALNNEVRNQGREQSGYRPALVISPKQYNQMSSLFLVCPITSTSKGLRFEVELGFDLLTRGVVLADQVKSLDWKIRKVRFIESVSLDLMEDVQAKLETLVF